MKVALLGPVLAYADDGSPVEIGGARLRALLARLAVDAGRVVSTSALIDGLWGQRPPVGAANALQSLISRLRKEIPADLVRSHPAGYRLDVDQDDVDLHAFRRLASQGSARLRAGEHSSAARILADALGLWRAEPFADVDAPFAGPVIARLDAQRRTVVAERIEAELALGRHHELLGELDELVAADPTNERLAGLRIRALHRAGRTADALAGYERVRRALADELGVDPSPELQRVQLAVLRNEQPSDSVAGQDPVAPQRNAPAKRRVTLPARYTSFVGREHELAAVGQLLETSRLVSLVGPGGAGKTRLATEVAEAFAGNGNGNDGCAVWFAELAPVGDGADVAQAVLTAVAGREVRLPGEAAQRTDATDRLVETVGAQRSLLVLDNCEQVIGAAAKLADALLAGCPGLRILTTTREPLAITGESLNWLGPLDLPDGAGEFDEHDDAVDVAAIGRSSAVRLFVDRARAARPEFALDAGNAAAVRQICLRLDGMPLALELAAARMRSMSASQIADRLDDRFRLLANGNRAALARHRTLRAVVDWSWELLSDAERALARRLSVFAGGVTVDSATSVCADDVPADDAPADDDVPAGDDVPAADVPYLLASLVEKSLVQQGKNGRYRMLETIRAYGAQRLDDAGEAHTTWLAMLRYFADFLAARESVLRTRDQLPAMAEISAEMDNIVAAIRRAVSLAEPEFAVRIVAGVLWCWMLTSFNRSGTELINAVLAITPVAPPAEVAVLRLVAEMLAEDVPIRTEEMRAALAECDRVRAESRYPVLAMIAPMVHMLCGDKEAAYASARRGAEHPDPWARAVSMLAETFVAEHSGDAARAVSTMDKSVAAIREIGERWSLAVALSHQSELLARQGKHADAVGTFTEAVRLISELGPSNDRLAYHVQLAKVRVDAGDLDGAERDLRIALDTVIEGANTDEVRLHAECELARVARERGDLAVAAEHLVAAKRLREGLRVDPGLPMHDANLAMTAASIALARGEVDVARAELTRCLPGLRQRHVMPSLARLTEWAARVTLADGDASLAAELVGASIAIRGMADRGDPDLRRTVAELTDLLGQRQYAAAVDRGAGLSGQDAIALLHNALGVSPT